MHPGLAVLQPARDIEVDTEERGDDEHAAAGAPVPVENTGGEGTRDSHWRESTFRSELMTGYINSRNPLSTVTVGALRDLGYTVSEARADAFSPAPATTGAGARASKGAEPGFRINERVFAPRRVRDAAGRVTVVPPGAAQAPR